MVSLLTSTNTLSKEAKDSGGKELSKAKLSKIYNPENYERDFEPGQVIVELNTEMPDLETSDGRVLSSSLPNGKFLGVEVDEAENFTVDVRSMPTKANSAINLKTISEEKEFVLTLADNSKQGVIDAINVLKENPKVKYAQPNYLYDVAQTTPNDPRYSELWGMSKIGMPAAWDIERGSSNVKVGVLDTGIAYDHVDLSANVHEEMGYNSFQNNFTNIEDIQGHGTHVAGTIGADGDNSTGVVGINWSTHIVPIKISNDSSPTGQSNSIALKRALTYSENIGLDVVNVSYEYFDGGYYDATMEEGLNYFEGLIVAAAGNGNSQYDSTYDCSNLILVGNSTENDAKAPDSSYGEAVDVFAPGTNILSTVPGNQYAVKSGTSMAAAHVTGAAALMKSHEPNLTAEEIKERISTNAIFNGISPTAGRLMVNDALMNTMRRSGDFTYQITSSTTATINRYLGNSLILEFPSTIDGYNVAEISNSTAGMSIPINPNTLTEIIIPNGVEAIGDFAFKNCINLQTINLPYGLKSLGSEAFFGCVSLAEMEIPDSVNEMGVAIFAECSILERVRLPWNSISVPESMFVQCGNLQTIDIPASVTSVDNEAFLNCTSLEGVTFLGATPPSVDSSTFANCSNLTTIYVPYDSMESYRRVPQLAPYIIKAMEFEYDVWSSDAAVITRYNGTKQEVEFPSKINGYTITEIGLGEPIMNSRNVTRISIPDGVGLISASAFYNCSELEKIRLPQNITSIFPNTFEGCTSLTSVVIPSNVLYIEDSAFYECTSLEGVTFLGASPPSVATSAFANCSNLTTIYVPYDSMAIYRGVPQLAPYVIKAIEFEYTVSGNKARIIKYNGTEQEVVFPSEVNEYSVTEIGSYVIRNLQTVTEVYIPDSITAIMPRAFYNCAELESIRLPEYLTRIEYATFFGCERLVNIEIPSSVTQIDWFAFVECTSLESIRFLSENPPTVGVDLFWRCMNLSMIYVPMGAGSRYQSVTEFAPYAIIEQ